MEDEITIIRYGFSHEQFEEFIKFMSVEYPKAEIYSLHKEVG